MNNQERDTFPQVRKKRSSNFREDETILLIKLWGSSSIQKLILTQKAKSMQLLSTNMQKRGFYRTPNEIQTKIRNLKCVYHRIKRTMACTSGIGKVEPNWQYFKYMDEILSRRYPREETNDLNDGIFDGINNVEHIQIKPEVNSFIYDSGDTKANVKSEYGYLSPPMSIFKSTTPRIYVKKVATLTQPELMQKPSTSTKPTTEHRSISTEYENINEAIKLLIGLECEKLELERQLQYGSFNNRKHVSLIPMLKCLLQCRNNFSTKFSDK